ncbi:MAG: serine/threonine protein kinase [Eubacterium sp.]|nr:serine/threonine protein kinase [Eubacterium sp.]
MKLCMGCMNQMDEKLTVCPHCGFNEAALRQESYYLKPGAVIGGKYIVGKALSYGGYTVTYIGMDAEKNRKVMIKEYLPSDFSTRSEGDTEVTIYSGDACEQFEQGLTTFLNEANRIGQLHNTQGIMRVYDCVAENDTGYVISEYLEGKTLKQIMEEGKRFPVQEAKEFVCRILEGLRQVHPLNIIHCDISPETILVTNTGEIKLLDFGATRYVTTANSKSLAIILKQGFAPEEQYRSRGERGPWTDVYALGAVMYYMITGVVPAESVDRALMDELKEPSKLGVQIPPNTENALMNALNVYQKDRTPSAEIFYQELNSPQVSRIQVKKQKYETGKFPTWAKFLVAGLLCVVVAGGVNVVLNLDGGDNGGKAQDKEPGIESIIDMTENEAIETLKGQGLTLEVTDAIFDKKEEEKVLTQSPSAGKKLREAKGGVVEVTLRSKKKCRYEDILEKKGNVNSLAKAFGIKRKKLIASKNDDEKHKFYDLYKIELVGGTTLFTKDLKKEGIITLSEIKSVLYYTSPYLYKPKLKDYVGKNIKDIDFGKYTEKDGKRHYTGKTEHPPAEEAYYSFEEEPGYIVEQTKGKGEKYDAREDKDDLFITVKERIEESHSLNNLIEELNRLGFSKDKNNLIIEGSGSKIDKVEVKSKNGGTKKLFTEEDTVVITRKEKPQAPSSENKTPSKPNGIEASPPQPSVGQIFKG